MANPSSTWPILPGNCSTGWIGSRPFSTSTKRAEQKFTVIQAVALAELDGVSVPNAYGDLPLIDKDPAKPAVTPGSDPNNAQAYDYWDHVDYIVDQANARGLYIAMLPSWGRWVNSGRGDEPLLTPANAQTYGEFLGKRFGKKGVIWILGGDRSPAGFEGTWRALAKGIAIGVAGKEDYSAVLMSFHPRGSETSSTWFHNDEWLDFNMQQTGHGLAEKTTSWARITADYDADPGEAGHRRRTALRRPPAGFQLQGERLLLRCARAPAGVLGRVLGRLRPHLWKPLGLADVRARPAARQRAAAVLVRSHPAAGRGRRCSTCGR